MAAAEAKLRPAQKKNVNLAARLIAKKAKIAKNVQIKMQVATFLKKNNLSLNNANI
jgi:hypothetical protein